jgi:hypothetical protein
MTRVLQELPTGKLASFHLAASSANSYFTSGLSSPVVSAVKQGAVRIAIKIRATIKSCIRKVLPRREIARLSAIGTSSQSHQFHLSRSHEDPARNRRLYHRKNAKKPPGNRAASSLGRIAPTEAKPSELSGCILVLAKTGVKAKRSPLQLTHNK